VLTIGGDDNGIETGEVDLVAGVNDAAGLAFDGFEIGGVVVAGNVGVFAVGAMIEELADLDALDEFGRAADVIHVKVRDQQVVDAGDAGIAHGGLDAGGVAAIVAGPSGVDQQRCAGCCVDQEGGLAAFDIDGVDEEVICGFRLGVGGIRESQQGDAAEEDNQARQKPAAKIGGAGIGGISHVRRSVHGQRGEGEGPFLVARVGAPGAAGVN